MSGVIVLIWSVCFIPLDLAAGNSTGYKLHVSSPDIRDESAEAMRLEKYKVPIEYFLKNLHKKTTELDVPMKETTLDHKYVTYCLIAKKYYWYGDSIKSAEYFYRDWLDQQNLLKGTTGPIPWDCGRADADSLLGAFSLWEENQVYTELVAHYPELYRYKMEGYRISSDVKLIKTNFEKYKKNWPEEARDYQEMMRKWGQAKKLAKTIKPKPLAPAVQHHEWFYSDKQEEVLRALAYYSKHKVNFMLEKALKHKDPIIAAKAKEYLENPVKDKEPAGDESKK